MMANVTKEVKVLIPTGYGLNCEGETAYAYSKLGAFAQKMHINDLIANPHVLKDYHILALVGGFSDGDHIASGKVHANRLKYNLGDPLRRFIEDGKLIIGVCNGFQALVKANILPGTVSGEDTQTVTLTYNDSGKFEDRWVHLSVNQKSNCVWTKGIESMYLPVRHGEGKIRVKDATVLKELEQANQIVLYYADPVSGKATMEYPHNPNGSISAIAAMCDYSGRIFGMMPHWEAYLSPYNHPNWTRMMRSEMPSEGLGLQIPRNAIKYVQETLLR
jgi:phosphoribosylformylglycinamidine synthase